MKFAKPTRALAAIAAVGALILTACGGANNESAEGFTPPKRVQVVVHTGPGGGGDLTAREVIGLLEKEDLITRGSWTVDNREGGNSAIAVSYLNEMKGRDDVIAFISNIWMTNAMVTEGVELGTLDLTPIAALVNDGLVVAVAASSPLQNMADLMAEAQRRNGELVQSGGSTTAIDAQAGRILQQEGSVSWRYLPFTGGGERKTAIARGDAQIYITEPGDILTEVKDGRFRVIATVGDERSPAFPDIPTTVEQGFTAPQPQQTRGVVGPPEMSEEAVAYYADLFTKFIETPSWAEYLDGVSGTTNGALAADYKAFLEQQHSQFTEIFRADGTLVGG